MLVTPNRLHSPNSASSVPSSRSFSSAPQRSGCWASLLVAFSIVFCSERSLENSPNTIRKLRNSSGPLAHSDARLDPVARLARTIRVDDESRGLAGRAGRAALACASSSKPHPTTGKFEDCYLRLQARAEASGGAGTAASRADGARRAAARRQAARRPARRPQSLREAADLLDKAQAALANGNKNLAEQLFSTAELLVRARRARVDRAAVPRRRAAARRPRRRRRSTPRPRRSRSVVG